MLRAELMKGEKGIENELRKEVDVVVRDELNNLKLQIESENPTKASGKKGKKEKGKKGKEKKEKETTEVVENGNGKKTEPFLSELVFLEVIKKYPKDVYLTDYIGCHRLMGIEDWNEPSMGQVREAISELVLPLGSEEIHKKSPHYKAVLLYGPEKSGKTMLTYAMANSVAATFIDLSPNTIAGKYDGAKETSVLIKMAFEVAKDMQPAIIYIDDFDWVLKGKGKGKNKKGGTRLKKELLAQVKALKPGERIMVVANSREPWDGDQPAFCSFFQRMVYTGIPDYGSINELWKKLIEKKTARPLPHNFDLSTLSYMSSGFASGSISTVVKKVLTDRRVKRLEMRPLDVSEFVPYMAKMDPVYLTVDKKFRGFTEKLPLKLRKKTKADFEKDKARIAEEKANAKPQKGKKK
jgi:SpoVK/Ycf46/Vps4 family AAA+-type ATPase